MWDDLMTVTMVHVKENMNPKITGWMKLSSVDCMLVSDVDTNVNSFGFVQLISSLTPVV